MHVKQKLMYMGYGCLLTLAGYILASSANDSVAQSGGRDVKFGKIICSELEVVDEEGKRAVLLRTNKHDGIVAAYGKGGETSATLGNDKYGGYVYVKGKDDESWATLGIDGYGGQMALYNKGGEKVLQASAADDGGGIITIKDKHGYRTGRLP